LAFLENCLVMQRTRIKFCGITRIQDMQLAVSLGVDAVGLVFASDSPRAVDVQQACTLISHCGPFVSVVGLFMDQDASTIKNIIKRVPLNMLQFHGCETESFCTGFGLPYLKSVAMGTSKDVNACLNDHAYKTASALLLDGNECGQPGGSGKIFDWSKVPALSRPVIVAGGLDADNVISCIQQVNPYAVDVSSGIESAKGEKDMIKMRDFVQSVRIANER